MHAVIAVSQYARQEIIKHFQIQPERVHAIYNGIDSHLARINTSADIFENLNKLYGITAPYILSVGRLEPHKNVLRLIQAYKILHDLGRNEKLVIVGGRHLVDYSDEVEALIKKNNLSDSVIITPFIAEKDLSAVYSGASVLAYVSLHEGFGLPILEAYACGVPVVVANNTALPEIAGNGARKCDPFSIQSIADALLEVLSDKNLAEQLISEGSQRVRDFTWLHMTEQTVALYK
jgi:glycosyltransferase involved in cell wall biosynthesis